MVGNRSYKNLGEICRVAGRRTIHCSISPPIHFQGERIKGTKEVVDKTPGFKIQIRV
jgi:hypothetical protein